MTTFRVPAVRVALVRVLAAVITAYCAAVLPATAIATSRCASAERAARAYVFATVDGSRGVTVFPVRAVATRFVFAAPAAFANARVGSGAAFRVTGQAV